MPVVATSSAVDRVTVLLGWRGKGPRNVLIQRDNGSLVVRPFRGLRKPLAESS